MADAFSVSSELDQKYTVPQGYGDNKLVLMARDPLVFYAYWEISGEVEDDVRSGIHTRGLTAVKSVLRVYDVTGREGDPTANVVFNFTLRDWATSWYVHVSDPGREWMADVGILCSTGEFFSLVRSNIIKTPVNEMSNVSDEDWVCPEELYSEMVIAAADYDAGKSSAGISSGMFGGPDIFGNWK